MLRRFPSLSRLLVVAMLVIAPHLAWSRGGGGGHGGGGHSFGGSGGHSFGGYSGHSSSIGGYSGGSHSSSGHSSSSLGHSSAGTVHVHGYTRKDGTLVAPYTRSAPHDHVATPSSSSAAAVKGSPAAHVPTSAASHAALSSHEHGTVPGIARDAHGRIERSAAARDAFMRSHPCPSTGRASGACPGYVVDHVVALKHGGADAPSNMEWQTIEAAKAKDRWE